MMNLKQILEMEEELKRLAKGVEDSSKNLMVIAQKQSTLSSKLSSIE